MPSLSVITLSLAGLLGSMVVGSAHAHHSFAAQFDRDRPVTLMGTVTEMKWSNPHAWIYIDTEDEAGNVENWAIELVGINDLLRLGWGRDKVKEGDVVSIRGFGARNGSNTANAASVRIANTGELLWESASRRD